MPRLTKHDAEALLATYDADPVSALTVALRRVLGRPGAGFDELVAEAPLPTDRQRALAARDQAALDALAGQLNEERTLPGAGRP